MDNTTVKTRFAPSPTGYLHVGGLRTALYSYLYAHKNKGEFLLRIEDTDQTRKVEGATEKLQETLEACHITWDKTKLMIQSKRLEIYQRVAEQLVREDKAYYCFCTPEELTAMRERQIAASQPPMYDGTWRNAPPEKIDQAMAEKKPYVIRMKMPKTGETVFTDLIRGEVRFENTLLDDQVILKSDGFPTYHLANVVDDHEMGITHVIRGEEWLSSTPKHIQLYTSLGFNPPAFAHLPLLLNPDKSKLSKRQGDVAVEDFLAKGYLPEALLNFVLLLGWNPGTEQEIFNLDEMVEQFSLEKVNTSGSVFDTEKLDWFNGHYIRALSATEFTERCLPFFVAAGIKTTAETLEKIVITEQQRIKRLEEIVPATRFFFETPQYETTLLQWKNQTNRETQNNLKLVYDALEAINEKNWQAEKIETVLKELISRHQLGNGDVLWPTRVALSGQKASPGPFEIAAGLGKKETLVRLNAALEKLAD